MQQLQDGASELQRVKQFEMLETEFNPQARRDLHIEAKHTEKGQGRETLDLLKNSVEA